MKGVNQYILLPLMIILLLTGGCAPSPSKGEIEETIVKYFEIKQYKVAELSIGNIDPVPVSKQQYMGTPGYTVNVTTLILEIPEDTGAPWNYRKGQRVSFKNIQMTIRQSSGQNKKWLIVNISGVPVP